jgi:small-conductance mechanosensitive channel
MIRKSLARLCLLALLASSCVTAQAQAQSSSSPATPSITPEQARRALDVLSDPAKRAEITATLEAIARAQVVAPVAPAGVVPTAKPASPEPAIAKPALLGTPLADDSLGAAVLVGAANFMNRTGERITDALHTARGVSLLWSWVVVMATDPVARVLLIDLFWRLTVALAAGVAVLICIAVTLQRPLRAVCRRLMRMPPVAAARSDADREEDHDGSAEARAEHGETEPPLQRRIDLRLLLRRVPLVLTSLALYLLPILGFVVAGHVIAGTALGGTRLTRLVLLAVTDSYALYSLALHLARAVLAPRYRRLRLLSVPTRTAVYAMRWIRRLLAVGVFGYAIAEVGLLLGLSPAAHLALLKATVLILQVFVAIIVIQKRRVVRGWIRAPAGAAGLVAGVRNRFAAIWHWIALFYLAALWLVWAVALPAGYEHVSRALLITLGVSVLARLSSRVCLDTLDRLLNIDVEVATRYPGLDSRLALYHPFLRAVVQGIVALLALLLFLQLLGFGAFEWLIDSPLGQRISGSLVMLTITCLLALAVWEAANVTLERRLARLTRQAQIARIARLRTLLPILRTTLLVVVLTLTVLMVLSEIGVNTAPLLASAGIIGVAIGFGSQKLVQDLITGLFLLLENTMQVGDVVSLGGLGLSGTIENLSVRTLRLRAEDGSVHVVPFSSVTTVTNMTRDYSRAVIQVSVAYTENVDYVIDTLKNIVTEMRSDAQFHEVILADLEVYGLEQFAPSAVVIKGRVMCTPFGRWSVGREFNRRMKSRFAELGIEMPSSEQRLVLDQPLTIRQMPPPLRERTIPDPNGR